jgi:hypothetical protein
MVRVQGLEQLGYYRKRKRYPGVKSLDDRHGSLFNTNPFFADPNLIILDDAHSAENYVSASWSLLIEKSKHQAAFLAIVGLVSRPLPPSDRSRLVADSPQASDHRWG